MLIRVDSLEDPRLGEYRDLRDASRARDGAFIAEGELVVRMLLERAARFPVRSVLLLDKYVERMRDVLGPDVPVYVAPPALLDGIIGFHLHRGCLAAATRPPQLDATALIGGGRLIVVAEDLTNHDNLGGVFRNAAAFGADAVLLGPRSCDPLYRKALRVAMGCTLAVPYARALDLGATLDQLAAAGFTLIALTPGGTTDLHSVQPPARLALLLGTEGPGLSPAALTRAHLQVRIPMAPGIDSLNVAAAAAVALYTLRK